MNVKELRQKFGLSQQQLAEQTGIPKPRIAKWEQNKGKPKADDLSILKNFFFNLETKRKEEVPREKDYISQRRDHKNNHSKRIPYYDNAPAAGGDVTLTEMTAIHAPSGTIDVGDLLHDSQAAIRIYGNSMLPNYPPGCVVGLVKCNDSFIEPGEVYVIETRERRLLKRLFYKDDNPNDEYITCYSDNIMKFEGGARHGKLAYPPFLIRKSEIINLYAVTGVIKRNTNSVIINR